MIEFVSFFIYIFIICVFRYFSLHSNAKQSKIRSIVLVLRKVDWRSDVFFWASLGAAAPPVGGQGSSSDIVSGLRSGISDFFYQTPQRPGSRKTRIGFYIWKQLE